MRKTTNNAYLFNYLIHFKNFKPFLTFLAAIFSLNNLNCILDLSIFHPRVSYKQSCAWKPTFGNAAAFLLLTL